MRDYRVRILKYYLHILIEICLIFYVRPLLDYGDVIYHNQRDDLLKLIEQVQYKASIIVFGCWQNTSRGKVYDELG